MIRNPEVTVEVITCKFTCNLCGFGRDVEVRVRGEKETIKSFVDRLAKRASSCHRANRPLCRGRSVQLSVPMPKEGTSIGSSEEKDPTPEYLAKWEAATQKAGVKSCKVSPLSPLSRF
jgi:hypothetical protein